jgi:hypothetical protein
MAQGLSGVIIMIIIIYRSISLLEDPYRAENRFYYFNTPSEESRS